MLLHSLQTTLHSLESLEVLNDGPTTTATTTTTSRIRDNHIPDTTSLPACLPACVRCLGLTRKGVHRHREVVVFLILRAAHINHGRKW